MVIKNLKSSVLVTAGFWFILLLFSVFCLTTYLNITRINDSLNEIINIAFPTVESGDDLIITLHDSSNLVRLSLFSKSLSELNSIENRFYDIIELNRKAIKRLHILSKQDQILETSLVDGEKYINDYINIAKKLFASHRLELKGQKSSINPKLLEELIYKVNSKTKLINGIIKHADMSLKESNIEINKTVETTWLLLFILFSVSVVMGFVITYLITRTISKAEEAKDNAYNEIDQIFNSASVGMWLLDKEFTVSRVNDTFLKMINMKREDILGKRVSDVWHKFKVKSENVIYEKIFMERYECDYEKKISFSKMKSIVCSIKAVPFLSNKGEIVGVLESFLDITEKKRIEKDIMHAIGTERQRIGQNLHDSLGQKLTGLSYLNQAIRNSLKKKKLEETNDIEESIDIISDLIDQTRLLSKSLYPANLEKFGLSSALQELSMETSRIFNISCETKIHGNILVDDPDIQANLFYIAKESINNSLKHGKAGKITISLGEDLTSIFLKIEDDGIEETAKKKVSNDKGIGMRIMKHRAGIIGASFNAESSGKGYIVTVRIIK